jgi:hypothetical protein
VHLDALTGGFIMSKKVTIEEAKGMLGTEFTYVFGDGDEVRAYVKAFDPKVGLTCYSLETKTKRGWCPADMGDEVRAYDVDPDGTFCVKAHDFSKKGHPLYEALEDLAIIRDKGKYWAGLGFGGVSCAF